MTFKEQQSQAVRLAEESVRRFGFVVVVYKHRVPNSIGERTDFLWKAYRMPQPFTVVRVATEDEYRAQTALFKELFAIPPIIRDGTPMVLVTD